MTIDSFFFNRTAEDVTGEIGGDNMQQRAAGWNLAWAVAKDSYVA